MSDRNDSTENGREKGGSSSGKRREAADLIANNREEIFRRWEEQVRKDIAAATDQDRMLLRNHLAPYLCSIVELLRNATTESAREHTITDELDDAPNKTHGRLRATLSGYSVEQVIEEYVALRQIITDLITQNGLLDEEVLEIICAVNENAMRHASTQFTNSLHILRQKAVSMLMHDVRTPLNIISVTAELVKRQSEAQEDNMDLVLTNARKIDRMVEQLLDAVRLEAGQGLKLQFTEADLRDTLYNSTEGALLIDPGRVQLSLPDEPAVGKFDLSGIARAVGNLVSNGLKYGDPKEKVTVELTQDARSYTISVHNWGEPIEDHEQASIFVTFARSQDAGKNYSEKGWGLGLAYVEAITEAHGGRVKVESSEHSGTTFSLVLPRESST